MLLAVLLRFDSPCSACSLCLALLSMLQQALRLHNALETGIHGGHFRIRLTAYITQRSAACSPDDFSAMQSTHAAVLRGPEHGRSRQAVAWLHGRSWMLHTCAAAMAWFFNAYLEEGTA